ncbi:nuclear transport factor 2 family protein [Microtetraspora sp. AC03309]|uniref:nuclear transport factor 2 family protein n=1 Tax=Microtetraspora sp. AC03309 TaxID=2779376 RepID=UPI001E5838F0|nr:nuclear transport factor 2 family protein [Microtetraspora sp. AC03309]MCC5581163.1 nuclear transport factor 2 family protein [Microtetraspora sp. AC03309]
MIDSPAVTWEAPDGDHAARRASWASMAAVTAGRRAEWLSLFAPDALVEDPVGPSMLDPEGKGHHGYDEIAAFWDAHVGSVREFHFHVRDSFANGPSCANVASITMTLDGGMTMTVDCVIIYTVDDAGAITSLRAHWEPDRAIATLTAPEAHQVAPAREGVRSDE